MRRTIFVNGPNFKKKKQKRIAAELHGQNMASEYGVSSENTVEEPIDKQESSPKEISNEDLRACFNSSKAKF